jgi:hypothetical protein
MTWWPPGTGMSVFQKRQAIPTDVSREVPSPWLFVIFLPLNTSERSPVLAVVSFAVFATATTNLSAAELIMLPGCLRTRQCFVSMQSNGETQPHLLSAKNSSRNMGCAIQNSGGCDTGTHCLNLSSIPCIVFSKDLFNTMYEAFLA